MWGACVVRVYIGLHVGLNTCRVEVLGSWKLKRES